MAFRVRKIRDSKAIKRHTCHNRQGKHPTDECFKFLIITEEFCFCLYDFSLLPPDEPEKRGNRNVEKRHTVGEDRREVRHRETGSISPETLERLQAGKTICAK